MRQHLGIALLVTIASLAACGDNSTVLVQADLDVRWTLDGKAQGILKAGDQVKLKLPNGNYLIQAVPAAGNKPLEAPPGVWVDSSPWEKLIIITEAESQAVRISLEPHMWTAADNGSDVDLRQAVSYCRNLALGGYHDWALPDIATLEQLYDSATELREYHIKGAIKLTNCCVWSSSVVENQSDAKLRRLLESSGAVWTAPATARYFDFVTGLANADRVPAPKRLALCVRRSAQ